MPTLHLLAGLPCSGKTTYSRKLVRERGGVYFCLDYWLISLFGKYAIEKVGDAEHSRRVLACRTLIAEVTDELLKKGSDVVLDDGFFLREHRMAYITRAKNTGADACIHFLDVPHAELLKRIAARNAALPEFGFNIDPNVLEAFGKIFERPSEAEGAAVIVTSA